MTTTPDVFGPTVDSLFPGNDPVEDAFAAILTSRVISLQQALLYSRNPEVRVRLLRVVLKKLERIERASSKGNESAFQDLMYQHLLAVLMHIPFVKGNDTPNRRVRLWVLEKMSSYIPSAWCAFPERMCIFLNKAAGSVLYGPSSEVLNLIRRTAHRMTADSLKHWMMIPETPDQVIEALALARIHKLSVAEILAELRFSKLHS